MFFAFFGISFFFLTCLYLACVSQANLDAKGADAVSIICVRQWRDVDAAREFRAFVHNGKLTACSQYCYYQCFPELVADRARLAQRIKDFFERNVLPVSPFKDAIVDLHVTDEVRSVLLCAWRWVKKRGHVTADLFFWGSSLH